jgi:hypothetical protein
MRRGIEEYTMDTTAATPVRVVARFLDGSVEKGTTQDFYPNRARFHLQPAAGGDPLEIRTADLKALFVVKSFAGDPARQKLRGFVAAPAETAQGKKIAVRFRDGELLCGYTLAYTPDRDGFFVTPADAGGNVLRAYVVAAAAAEIKAGPAADALAERALGGGK